MNLSRRSFLGLSAATVVGLIAVFRGSRLSAAPNFPLVKEDEPLAKALNYHHDAKAVPDAKKPTRSKVEGKDQTCQTCLQFKAGTGDTGTCNIISGKLVKASGWCQSWAKK